MVKFNIVNPFTSVYGVYMFLAILTGAIATPQPVIALPHSLFPSIPSISAPPEWMAWLHGATVGLGMLVLGMIFVWSVGRVVGEVCKKVDEWTDFEGMTGLEVANAPVCECSPSFVPGVQNCIPPTKLCVVCALSELTQSLQSAERHLATTRAIIAEISSHTSMRPSQHTCDHPYE